MSYTRLDRKVETALAVRAEASDGITSNVVADAFRTLQPPDKNDTELSLDLETALHMASRYNRDFQNKRESLYRKGLSLLKQRRSFGVGVFGAVDYVFRRTDEEEEDTSSQITAGADRIIYTGGEISLSAQSSGNTGSSTNSGARTIFDNSLTLRVEQPLLAGAGHAVSHEDLIQAERNLIYALRSFSLERQDFAIFIVRQYYNLLIQQEVLDNIRSNVEQSTLLRLRSEAMFKVRRAPAIDVMRSQQQELSAKNGLSRAEADFDIQLKRFVLEMGLPINMKVSLKGSIPDLRQMMEDENTCIDMALALRLDLKTVCDEYEDAKRKLRVRRSALLPELDVYAQTVFAAADSDSFAGGDYKNSYSAGVTLQIPFDKRDERDAARTAKLDVTAAARTLKDKEEQVKLEISENFSNLRFLAGTVDIERQNGVIAERRARNALLRFKNGELLNRDVVEAENELLDARNAYVRALVSYEMQRIQLVRNAGALDVSASGLLVELPLTGRDVKKQTGGAVEE